MYAYWQKHRIIILQPTTNNWFINESHNHLVKDCWKKDVEKPDKYINQIKGHSAK